MRSPLPLFLVLFPFLGHSQCSVDLGDDILQCNGTPVTLMPVYSGTSSEDSLRIVYDATQGVSGLTGASTVYFHSAIQIIPFDATWEYAIGNWGADDGVGQMSPLANNMWGITIMVEDYYGLPGGTTVNGLWMVFRNADGSATGKDDNDEDIFLYTAGGNTSDFSGITGMDIPGSDGSFLWNTSEETAGITVSQGGTYSVTYTDGTGCAATDEITVEFGNGAVTVDLGSDIMLCSTETLTLDAGTGYASYDWSTGETGQTIEVDAPGDYSVTVTDQSGCTGIDLINIAVGALPDADFSYSSVTGLTVGFTDIGSGADMVYWDFDGDWAIDDSTSGGGSVQHEFPNESVFGVRMVAVNSCGSDTVAQNVIVQNVSVEELKDEVGFSAYPNPTDGRVTISFSDASVSVLNIRLMDSTGRQILADSLKVGNSIYGIDMGRLPTGIYLLEVLTSKGTVHQRILKQ